MRTSIALEPKSHCDSRTPITGVADSRVSFSLGSQSWADAESDQRTIPIWFWGQEPRRVDAPGIEIRLRAGPRRRHRLDAGGGAARSRDIRGPSRRWHRPRGSAGRDSDGSTSEARRATDRKLTRLRRRLRGHSNPAGTRPSPR
jgi:hypothetical protein